MKLVLVGVEHLNAAIAAAGPAAKDALAAGLIRAAEEVLAEAVPITPFRYGTLRGSAGITADSPRQEGTKVTVTFGFGGAAASYAVEQHENRTYVHTVGQAKFLETPLLAYAAHFGRTVSAHLESYLAERMR